MSTVVYFGCRTCLSYRCNQYFETAFPSDVEMAAFLGRYTQWALAGSLLLQLLFIHRWIAWVGLRGAQMSYAVLLFAAAVVGGMEMTLATAVFARFVECELRFGLRNPTAQLIVNQFSRAVRIRVRAWSLGLLIPLSTFGVSLVLAVLVAWSWQAAVGGLTLALGGGYLLASLGLSRHCERPVELATEVRPAHEPA